MKEKNLRQEWEKSYKKKEVTMNRMIKNIFYKATNLGKLIPI